MFLWVSETFKQNVVHEALIDAEILTSPLPYIIAQLDPVIRYQCFTCGCANTFQVVWKYSNVSQNSLKKFVIWGPNRCWDIDFPTPLCICSTWPSYQVPMLHLWVCQHLPSGLKIFQCVSEFSKKFGVWGSNRCWDIDSSTPPCICSSWPRYGHWCSACECANTLQVV